LLGSQCRCPLGYGPDGDGDNPYPLPALLSAYRTDCHNQATTFHAGRFRRSLAKIGVSDHRDLEESLLRPGPLCRSPSHIGCAARAAPIAVAASVAATASGVAEAPSVGTKIVVLVFGGCRIRDRKLSTRRDRNRAKTAWTSTSRGNRRWG